MDDETIKKCNDCAPEGLTYSRRDGRAQVMIGQDFLADELGGMESQIEQAMQAAQALGLNGAALSEAKPRPTLTENRPQRITIPRHETPQPTDLPDGLSDVVLVESEALAASEPYAPPPSHGHTYTSQELFGEILGLTPPGQGAIKNFTLANIGLGELIGAGPPKEGATKNFTLYETDAADVLPGGMLQQDSEENGDDKDGIKTLEDEVKEGGKWPWDAFDELKRLLKGWTDEEAIPGVVVEEGVVPAVPPGAGEAPRAVEKASPVEKRRLDPPPEGKGCRGETIVRRFTHKWEETIVIDRWLVGGCHKYAPGSAKSASDLEEEARYATQLKMLKEGLIEKEDVVEPDTIETRARECRNELMQECKEWGSELLKPWTRRAREEIADRYNFHVRWSGLPLSLLDPTIRKSLSGLSCPLDCVLSYKVLRSRLESEKAEAQHVTGHCSEERVAVESWQEQRGTDRNGNPIMVEVKLELAVIVLQVVLRVGIIFDADIEIYCEEADD